MSTELPKSIKFGNNVFHFPWISFVPRPSEEEEVSIQGAIAENGVYPPLCWKDTDGTVNVVNGHTRLMIAAKLGIKEIPEPAWFKGNREEAEIAAVAENAVHRDWTRETRLKTVGELFGRQWPQRKIARALGVSQGQVRYDLIHLGLIEEPKPKPAPVPEPAPAAKPEPAAPPEPSGESADEPEGEEPKPSEDSKPADSKPADSKPTPSVADKRQANIDAGKSFIQKLTRIASELDVFGKVEEPLSKILGVFLACDKGQA